MFNEEQQFIALKARILKGRGLDCGQYKTNYHKRRIAIRMRAHGVESYREYMRILDSVTLEYNKLMDCLTINITQFFRDPPTFEALEKAVLPQLVADKQYRKSRIIGKNFTSKLPHISNVERIALGQQARIIALLLNFLLTYRLCKAFLLRE